MDTTDTEIIFDNNGICNHCNSFYKERINEIFTLEEGVSKLKIIFDKIKKNRIKHKYDCILGISGGVDSSYLALILKKYNLRVLLVHVDAGWNLETAVSNIKAVVDYTGFDLYTEVVDWDDMRNLQIAYLESGISNQDVPQDHIFFSVLYRVALKNKIKYFISGGNIATESILPESWHGNSMDAINLKDIYKKYGKKKLQNYKTISFWNFHIFSKIRGLKEYRPLNYLDYNKQKAIIELENIGWKNYGRKHGESFFTKFFQNYFLYKRFNIDKRRAHLSSLILSKQMSRNEAIKQLNEDLYKEDDLINDKLYFCNKLQISLKDLERYLNLPLNHYTSFRNWDTKIIKLNKFKNVIRQFF
jgi:N-acetyl sugar amidotransferase